MNRDWSQDRVLVTGGTGFIGSFLVEQLLAHGAAVRVPMRSRNYRELSARRSEVEWMEGDLRESAFCRQLLSGITLLFHFASSRRNVAFHHAHCGGVYADNVWMSLSLSEAMRQRPIPVVFCSTANIPPGLDTALAASSPGMDGYVLGKLAAELAWLTAATEKRFPLLILRPVGVYGPRDTFSLEGNVIPSLMVKARDARDHLEVWGSGNQVRSFLYVEDLTSAVLVLVETGASGIQYLPGSERVAIRHLAERIRDAVRPGLPIRFDLTKPEGSAIGAIPPSHGSLRHFPWTTLQEGLRRTVEWWTAQ